MNADIPSLLKAHNLRDTQSRRLVIDVLSQSSRPLSQKDIHALIEERGAATNLVTVYRVVETLEKIGVLHKHPSTGDFTLCSMQNRAGHHGFLHCQSCGTVAEFIDAKLCGEENRIAAQAGFTPTHHVSEIVGLCSSCA